MDAETRGAAVKLALFVVVAGGTIWMQCAAPCEVFATAETRLLPARCLSQYTQPGGR